VSEPTFFRFDYAGLHGRPAACGLEILPLAHGGTAVICTELSDNPGTSVTNFAEELASIVCRGWRIEPEKLVWIEHYPAGPCPVCGGSGARAGLRCRACHGNGRTRATPAFDRVTFRVVRSGTAWHFAEPDWRPMRPHDWAALEISERS
jgi:hypothetical protein